MADELKTRFTRARLEAIMSHELSENDMKAARAEVFSVSPIGYIGLIEHLDGTRSVRLYEVEI
jgi:hypothetical protein